MWNPSTPPVAVYRKDGGQIAFRTPTRIPAGEVKVFGGAAPMVGVTRLTAPENTDVVYWLTDEYDFPKQGGEGGVAFEVMAPVYWSENDQVATATATDVYLGRAKQPAAATAGAVRVEINVFPPAPQPVTTP